MNRYKVHLIMIAFIFCFCFCFFFFFNLVHSDIVVAIQLQQYSYNLIRITTKIKRVVERIMEMKIKEELQQMIRDVKKFSKFKELERGSKGYIETWKWAFIHVHGWVIAILFLNISYTTRGIANMLCGLLC